MRISFVSSGHTPAAQSSAALFSAVAAALQSAGHQVHDSLPDSGADLLILPADSHTLKEFAGSLSSSGRIILLSSYRIYRATAQMQQSMSGDPVTAPQGENAPLRTDTAHPDADLVAAETFARQHASSLTILRLPQIFGPQQVRQFGEYLNKMLAKRPAIPLHPAVANWKCTCGYVADVAAAITKAATDSRALGQIYNIGEYQTPTVAERLHLLARAAGYRGKILVVPARLAPAHLHPHNVNFSNDIIMDTGRILRELGFADVTPEKQLWQQTVEWEKTDLLPDSQASINNAAEDELLRKFGLISRS